MKKIELVRVLKSLYNMQRIEHYTSADCLQYVFSISDFINF